VDILSHRVLYVYSAVCDRHCIASLRVRAFDWCFSAVQRSAVQVVELSNSRARISAYVRERASAYVCACICALAYVYVRVCICEFMRACMCVRAHMRVAVRVCMCVRAHARVHVRACMCAVGLTTLYV
jgi:hypothetical protein